MPATERRCRWRSIGSVLRTKVTPVLFTCCVLEAVSAPFRTATIMPDANGARRFQPALLPEMAAVELAVAQGLGRAEREVVTKGWRLSSAAPLPRIMFGLV